MMFFFNLTALNDTRNILTEAAEDGENGEHCATWLGDVAKRKAPNATLVLLANHNKAIPNRQILVKYEVTHTYTYIVNVNVHIWHKASTNVTFNHDYVHQ